MRINISEGSTHEYICSIAEQNSAKWIVIFADHYRGNNKGYYQSIGDFRKSKVSFHWHNEPEDRGATSVFITDEDIPALVQSRVEIVRQLNLLEFHRKEELIEFWNRTPRPKIDNRWKASNPKRIEAEQQRERINEAVKEINAHYQEDKDSLVARLQETDFLSSSLIEMKV